MTAKPETVEQVRDAVSDMRLALEACQRILSKLKLLPAAPTTHHDLSGIVTSSVGSTGLRTRDSHGLGVKSGRTSDSIVPYEVMNGQSMLGNGHAPDAQLNLYAHYFWRMKHAQKRGDAGMLMRLAGEATRAYEEWQGNARELFATDEEAVTALLRRFEGVDDVEAAVALRAPNQSYRAAVEWVRRTRRMNGRNPDDGASLPSFMLNRRARNERVIELAANGVSMRAIGEEVGISHTQVKRIVESANHDR